MESSESEAETEMTHMFQLGEMRRKLKISRKVEQKEMPDLGEEGGTRKKKLVDEAMINIVCDNIATNTTSTALRQEDLPSGPIMKLRYAGSWAILRIKQT